MIYTRTHEKRTQQQKLDRELAAEYGISRSYVSRRGSCKRWSRGTGAAGIPAESWG